MFSVILSLCLELLKHTPENSPDRKQLESALESLTHVLSLINEDKRKMEGLCRVFDIFNLIDKCPVSPCVLKFGLLNLLVSKHKSFSCFRSARRT